MPVRKVGRPLGRMPEGRRCPAKTIANRFARWSECGIWQQIFATVASPSDAPERTALDSYQVNVQRCAGALQMLPPRGSWDFGTTPKVTLLRAYTLSQYPARAQN